MKTILSESFPSASFSSYLLMHAHTHHTHHTHTVLNPLLIQHASCFPDLSSAASSSATAKRPKGGVGVVKTSTPELFKGKRVGIGKTSLREDVQSYGNSGGECRNNESYNLWDSIFLCWMSSKIIFLAQQLPD